MGSDLKGTPRENKVKYSQGIMAISQFNVHERPSFRGTSSVDYNPDLPRGPNPSAKCYMRKEAWKLNQFKSHQVLILPEPSKIPITDPAGVECARHKSQVPVDETLRTLRPLIYFQYLERKCWRHMLYITHLSTC